MGWLLMQPAGDSAVPTVMLEPTVCSAPMVMLGTHSQPSAHSGSTALSLFRVALLCPLINRALPIPFRDTHTADAVGYSLVPYGPTNTVGLTPAVGLQPIDRYGMAPLGEPAAAFRPRPIAPY